MGFSRGNAMSIGPTFVVRERLLPNGSGSGDPELQA